MYQAIMKVSISIFALAGAQTGMLDGEESANLIEKIENAQGKCQYFMKKAYYCQPPQRKIEKYSFRLKKVMFDAVYHYNKGKCRKRTVTYHDFARRKRREDAPLEYDYDPALVDLDLDIHQLAKANFNTPKPSVINRLEDICRKFLNSFWAENALQNCSKLGAWKKRSDELLQDMNAMKNICTNNKGKYKNANKVPDKS